MWGQPWGSLVWGSHAVPLMGPLGMLALFACLVAMGVAFTRRSASRVAVAIGLCALVGAPLVAVAAQLTIPFVFANGEVADAGEVNANFAALVDESNDQDTRIAAVEGASPLPGYQIRTLTLILGTSGGFFTQAPCPTGKVVVGGGYEFDGPFTSVRVDLSAPRLDGSAWRVRAGYTAAAADGAATLYAVCVDAS